MPKPTPLAFQAVIPDKDGAIKFGGGAGDHATLILTVYADELAEAMPQLLNLRGERLYVTFVREDEVERSRREQ